MLKVKFGTEEFDLINISEDTVSGTADINILLGDSSISDIEQAVTNNLSDIQELDASGNVLRTLKNYDSVQTFRVLYSFPYATEISGTCVIFSIAKSQENRLLEMANLIESLTNKIAEMSPEEETEKTFEDLKADKVAELNAVQQSLIHSGVSVTFADGTSEVFTLTENDQISLMELQALAQTGVEYIPWHNNNQLEGCKYYSLADFMAISNVAIPYITYHVTYFRDLRRYVLSMTTEEELSTAVYGMDIPEEFQSEVLKDLIAKAKEGSDASE